MNGEPMIRAVRRVSLIQQSVLAAIGLVCGSLMLQAQSLDRSVLVREFIYGKAPFRSAHASTIVETPARTLLAAWFGGTNEGNRDVEIWLSRKTAGKNWSAPIALTETPDMPTWNPVLFQDGGTTWLFFKVGPSPREWVGGYRISGDDGVMWSPVKYLPAGLTGPIRAKPIRLTDGTWLAGTSFEAGYDSNTGADAPSRSWAVWVERSTDRGTTWTKHGPIVAPDEPYGVIQPTLWETSNSKVQMLMRSTERLGQIMKSSSDDGGRAWLPARRTQLPNPNAGIDVLRLRSGVLLLVYNHLKQGRNAIHLAVSKNEGETWGDPYLLEGGQSELSYPAVIQSIDGMVHITYTWNRTHIRHLVINPDLLPK